LNVDLHFTPFLSLANVIGDETIKVKSWDVIRIPAAQQFGGSGGIRIPAAQHKK
jgi:hypothetical protein